MYRTLIQSTPFRTALMAGAGLLIAACASPADAPPAAAPAPAPAAAPAPAPTPAPAPAAAVGSDYSQKANWLCFPGQADACAANVDATVVTARGDMSVEAFKPAADPPIDCFYVYPTVSLDAGTNSDLKPGPEELSVVKSQLVRLGAKCRIYAPMYRQITMAGLRARMMGAAAPEKTGTPEDANADVNAAWDWYMANANKGRGVVLVGHSQGSGQLMRLIASKIDGQPQQKQVVSALLLGMSVQVPKGGKVGGTFKSMPLCDSADQHGCVVSYVSFRSDVTPAPTSMFGRSGGAATEAACVSPAKLVRNATDMNAYFSAGTREWVKGKSVTTPYVSAPGLVTAECVRKDGFHFLEVKVNADPADPRADDMGGDVPGAGGKPDANWGLHLIDANLQMGDLVTLVGRQGDSWLKANK